MKSNRGKVKSRAQSDLEEREILKPIRNLFEACSFNRSGQSIKLPEYVGMQLCDRTLTIAINTAKHPTKNDIINPICDIMQNDASAFEGWAICIKAWLPEKVKRVYLTWEEPESDKKNGHYYRFLYRVMKFAEWYGWFSFEDTHNSEIEDFRKVIIGAFNNCSSKEAERKGGTRYEEQVEYDLIHQPSNQDLFCQALGLTNAWHHLPVGVKDKDGKSIFTGRQSAIDLWGMTPGNALKIIELKYNIKIKDNKEILHNIKVGIISELMFYCQVMNDIRLEHIVSPKLPQIEKECLLYGTKWSAIEGVMLATDYHPLLYKAEDIISLLNQNSAGVRFSMFEYRWNLDKRQLLSIFRFNPSCK